MAIAFPVKRWLVNPPPGVRVQRGHPLASGLVSAWAFAEGGGNTSTDAAGVLNGIGTASPTWNTSDRGSAITFNGTTSYLTCGGTVKPSSATQGTFWARVRVETNPATAGAVFSWGTDGSNVRLMFAIHDAFGNGSNRIHINNSGVDILETASTTVLTNSKWFDIAVTGDGTAWAAYIDAVSQSFDAPLGGSNTGKWYGALSGTGVNYSIFGALNRFGAFEAFLAASVSHAALWDRVLAVTELQQLKADPFAFYQPPVSLARRVVAAQAAVGRGLFRPPPQTGVGIGASFFRDPLQGSAA